MPAKWELSDPNVQKLIYFLLIGLVAGWLTGKLLGGGGLIRNLVVGVIGAFVGAFIVAALNLPIGLGARLGLVAQNALMVDQLAVATLGSIVVVLLARFIAR